MFTANFHTHTTRCGHAVGEDEEYVKQAIAAGIKTLGFSDHAPYDYGNGWYDGDRMSLKVAEDYALSVRKLKEKYADKIDIYLGFETEYYPALFDRFLKSIEPFRVDYLILGQHYLNNEYDGKHCLSKDNTEEELTAYVNQTIEGLATGWFSYLAHPDVFRFNGNDEFYVKEMKRLCVYAKEKDIPLEFNLWGFADDRTYPSERFFKIAAETGNTVIYGADAHRPDFFAECPALIARANKALGAMNVKMTDKIKLLNGKIV